MRRLRTPVVGSRPALVLMLMLMVMTVFGGASSAGGCGYRGSGPEHADRVYGDAVSTTSTSLYGAAPQQFGTLSVPAGPGPHPVVVLVHGGFWRARYGLDLMEPLVDDLVARGYAAWNIEYRRVGDPGGGYPGTLDDVAAAVDHLTVLAPAHGLDLDRVAVVGHSAGGHLALWLASRDRIVGDGPGSHPAVVPGLVVGLAAVSDLADAAREGLGQGATQDFLGGEPDEVADAYELAQPRLDTGRVVLVHGDRDDIVPVHQSQDQRGAEVVVIAGEDHFSVIDPTSRSWEEVVVRLGQAPPVRMTGPGRAG